jgi:hypothetical protein
MASVYHPRAEGGGAGDEPVEELCRQRLYLDEEWRWLCAAPPGMATPGGRRDDDRGHPVGRRRG